MRRERSKKTLRNAPVTNSTQDAGQDQDMDGASTREHAENVIYGDNRIARLSSIQV